MVTAPSQVEPTANPALEDALRGELARRNEVAGSLGELEPLAVRLGLMQNTLKPRLRDPRLLIFASDHGIAVDGLVGAGLRSTAETVHGLVTHQLPLTAFARTQDIGVTVVDCGMSEDLAPQERLLVRKIAHGTRNSRVASAMSLDLAHAAMRAGMDIGDHLSGNATIFAGVGLGANESAALVLARLTDYPLHDMAGAIAGLDAERQGHLSAALAAAQSRHRDIVGPVETLAAFGGFDVAMMVGLMLRAGSKRHLLMVDGLPACAALMVASLIAPPVTDYCVFSRSQGSASLDRALDLFKASALLELGLDATDGTGATLAWPLVRCAAALLADVAEGEEPAPTSQVPLDAGPEPFQPAARARPVAEAPVEEEQPEPAGAVSSTF